MTIFKSSVSFKAALFLLFCIFFLASHAQNKPSAKGKRVYKSAPADDAKLNAIKAMNEYNNKLLMDEAFNTLRRESSSVQAIPSATASPPESRSVTEPVAAQIETPAALTTAVTPSPIDTQALVNEKSTKEQTEQAKVSPAPEVTPLPISGIAAGSPVLETPQTSSETETVAATENAVKAKSVDLPTPPESEQRLALIIGNSNYKVSPLINPTNDARAMAIALQKLGFTVIKKENAGREEMMTSVREFGNRLRDKGGVGLFYYAGHGIQSKGVNYLIPTDANIAGEDELSTRAYDSAEVLEKMDTAKNRINMVILDACRDNPFAKSFRSGSRGLASVATAPSGTLIAYATSPGSVASDGSGSNGLYTEQLLNAIAEPGLKLEDVFKRVRVNVMERSDKKQTPWETSSVTGDFYFNPGETQLASMRPVLAAVKETAPRLQQILIPKKLVENYQLDGSFQLDAVPNVSAFSASSHEIRFGTPNKILSTWNTQDGRSISTDTDLNHIRLTPDKKQIVALNDKNQVVVFDLNDVSNKSILMGVPNDVMSYSVAPDGQSLLLYSKSAGYYLFDLKKLTLIVRLNEMYDSDAHAAFSPTSDRFVTWSPSSTSMFLWDAKTGQKINRLSSHWKPVGLVQFSADGSLILSAAQEERMIITSAVDGKTIRKLDSNGKDPLPSKIDFLANSKRILVHIPANDATATKPQLLVWDWNSGAMVGSVLSDRVKLQSYFVSPIESKLFINAGDNTIHVFDLMSMKRINTLVGMRVLSLAADGKFVYTANPEGIRIIDAKTLSPIARLPDQVAVFESVPGSVFVATSSALGSISLWDRQTGQSFGSLEGHVDVVSAVFFSSDTRRIISISSDNKALIWALPDIKDIHKLEKDPFETSADFLKRMNDWNSPYNSLVDLLEYNADTEVYTLQIGDVSFDIPYEREKAKLLSGQTQAKLAGTLKFLDADQLIVESPQLSRLK